LLFTTCLGRARKGFPHSTSLRRVFLHIFLFTLVSFGLDDVAGCCGNCPRACFLPWGMPRNFFINFALPDNSWALRASRASIPICTKSNQRARWSLGSCSMYYSDLLYKCHCVLRSMCGSFSISMYSSLTLFFIVFSALLSEAVLVLP